MLNWIWLGLVVLGVLLGAISGQLGEVTAAAFEACKTAVMTLALPLAGIMALWLGIMRLAEKSGLVGLLAAGLRPVMRWLFPDVPINHPAMGSMVMNMAANMLGLANAATPLGLRAMQDLEKLNPRPGVATNAMCTFLAINTSSIQLIPATTVGILSAAGASNPTSIIGTAFMATVCSTAAGIIAVKSLQRLPWFALPKVEARSGEPTLEQSVPEENPPATLRPVWRILLLLALLFFAFLFATIAYFPAVFESLANSARSFLAVPTPFAFPPEWTGRHWLARSVEAISLLAIPFILTMFPLYAAARRVPVYEEFVEGAKEGFQVAIRIIPFLVAILAAIGMFRAAGGIDLLARLLSPIFEPLHFPPELLPLVLMRPLSGSGANGIFAELVKAHGPDSLIARMGATVMGSTETTFYVIAVYFGSVAIRRTRHAVAAGLIADLAGVIASVLICNLVFG
ncbi:MAG TPA: nucleoside recognition domain-containing protein [Terrimicrobiaceae bacterium]|nr:nucleoside recognition domain-containing protein [Terrimicrobiaceae bacterium]